MGKKPVPIPKEFKEYLLETLLPKDIVDQLAEFIHEGWWEEKIKQGFHHPSEMHEEWDPKNPKHICNKCHFDMLPYPELLESAKILDKITVETILAGLYILGYELRKCSDGTKFDLVKWKREHNIE